MAITAEGVITLLGASALRLVQRADEVSVAMRIASPRDGWLADRLTPRTTVEPFLSVHAKSELSPPIASERPIREIDGAAARPVVGYSAATLSSLRI